MPIKLRLLNYVRNLDVILCLYILVQIPQHSILIYISKQMFPHNTTNLYHISLVFDRTLYQKEINFSVMRMDNGGAHRKFDFFIWKNLPC